MKFIAPISTEIKQTLEEMRYHHPSPHYRLRAEAILLNSRGFSVPKISQIIEYERKAICRWLDNWQKSGLVGLYDKPRSGRPSILNAQDVTLVEELVKEEPRQLKQALAKFEKITGKKASCYTLKRVLKKLQYTWKRCRRSLKTQRDETEFRQEQVLQTKLLEAEENNEVQVVYFDASGFTTVPCVPYAWQKKSQTLELPSKLSKRLNILGFMRKNNDSFFYPHEGNVTTETVIKAFEAFGQHYAPIYAQTKIPCVVILDNAPVQTSAAFLEKSEDWYSYGLMLHFLPTYSPELNLIEILWRKMKYEWISFSAYTSYIDLKNEVLEILSQVGQKYTITFA